MKEMETQADLLDFYRTQTAHSAPGIHSSQYKSLPSDLPSLANVLHGIIIHMWWISEQNYGLTHDSLGAAGRDILGEISLATVEEMLTKIIELDPRPLSERRDANKRLVGNCRDYSLMLVSILRSRGIPARARTGVGTYFFPGEFRLEDHWICEFWNSSEKRWQQTDAQIDKVMREATKMPQNPVDLPAGAFLTGWQCYDALSSGRVKPVEIGFDPGFNGMRYVRQKLIEDLACVTGYEVLPWAAWGIGGGDGGAVAGDEALTEQIAHTLRDIDEPAGLQQAIDLMQTHPRVKRPTGYSAGRFQEAWL
jgi:hypothetical protein